MMKVNTWIHLRASTCKTTNQS